jgi:hypothetical protein
MHYKQSRIIRWFSENGGYLDKALQLSFDPNEGNHFLSGSNDVGAGTVACTCPMNMTMSHLNVLRHNRIGARDESSTSACVHLVEEVEFSTVAAFFLVEQRLLGEKSFWFPYIDLLPKEDEMTMPLWFNSDDLMYLRGTNLVSQDIPMEITSVGLQKARYKQQWTLGTAALQRAGQSPDQYTW